MRGVDAPRGSASGQAAQANRAEPERPSAQEARSVGRAVSSSRWSGGQLFVVPWFRGQVRRLDCPHSALDGARFDAKYLNSAGARQMSHWFEFFDDTRHWELENELKQCRKIVKEIKDRKEKLVEEARKKIDEAEAKKLILARWERTLFSKVDDYLIQYNRGLRSKLENLWEKYHQPMHSILKDRDEASAELSGYLKELGYE